jgi:hypothetical protein
LTPNIFLKIKRDLEPQEHSRGRNTVRRPKRIFNPKKEDTMAIEVFIRRKVIESNAKDLSPLIVKLRSLATIQPGYIPASNIQGEK